MQKLKHILRWTVGIFIAFYLLLSLAVNIPFVQTWLAGKAGDALSSRLGATASVGRIQLGFNCRVIIDDISLCDQQGAPMLQVSRLGGKIKLWEFLERRVSLGSVQLFGMRARLYQQTPESKPNFWFVVDAFSSNDTAGTTNLNLRIGQILIRRTNVTWDQRWREPTPGQLNTGHISLQNLSLTAELNTLTNDSLDVELRRFSVSERESGIAVQSLTLFLTAGRQGLSLKDFNLTLPHSTLSVPALSCDYNFSTRHINNINIDAQGELTTQDFIPVSPALKQFVDKISFTLQAAGPFDNIRISRLKANDTMLSANVELQAYLFGLSGGLSNTVCETTFSPSSVSLQPLSETLNAPVLEKLGDIELQGSLRVGRQAAAADMYFSTVYGGASLRTVVNGDGEIEAELSTEGLHLGHFLDKEQLGEVAMDVKANGHLRDDLKVSGNIASFEFRDYTYHNTQINGIIHKGQSYEGELQLHDANISLHGTAKIDPTQNAFALKALVEDFSPNALHLTGRFPDTRFSGSLMADVRGNVRDSLDGTLHVDGFTMSTGDLVYRPGDIHVSARHHDAGQQFTVISPFLEAQLAGEFTPKNLVSDFMRLLVWHVPTLIPSHFQGGDRAEDCSFTLKLYNTQPFRQLLGMNVDIDSPLIVEGAMDTETYTLSLTADIPHLRYSGEDLRDVSLRLESYRPYLLSSVRLKRLMKGAYVDFSFEATGQDDQLTTKFYWDNNRSPSLRGDVSIVSRFRKDELGKYYTEAHILPSDIVAADSLWHVSPGSLSFYDGTLTVDSLKVRSGDHLLSVRGRASRESADTLRARLEGVSLENIFSLVNFHAVELSGEATGDVYLHSLFGKPYMDAYLRVPRFALNGGVLGNLDIHGNWGQRDYSIFLDAVIRDTLSQARSYVQGYVTPKQDVPYHGLDLTIQADHLNIYFLNKYTGAIFDEMRGNASGTARLFGPFKQLNIEGGLLVHEGSMGIPYLGVRYHVEGDSVNLSPGSILFTGVQIYDPQGAPGKPGHRATLDGKLRHSHFSNLKYDITLSSENLLAYNFKDFDDLPFCGTVYATGEVSISGSPGQVNINVKARPQQGTTLTYDYSTPDNVPQNAFVTYVDRHRQEETPEAAERPGEPLPENDIHINLDLDIDDRSTMNLIMDSRSGDMISVNGSGHMLARYYNKGDFQLFGTYRIERGTYDLSLQEVIRKNFSLTEGGTIVFTGEPLGADLNVQASHTVSGVSLNDISARSTFSNTSARVNCLMNISGKASQPYVTFDFDVLNVNEDEKQMVRSLISTDEERNMQVIYLLGIGRFYTYDYSNESQSQGSTAMNSLLSSTLSGQLNQMFSNMIHNSNWSFGTNLNTGTTGWSDLDVEGMLQGSLLNNRLLINGNFGYRDNPANSSNFIGDFDAQYHLTRSGSVSLKAYNKTNDRYFTKTSLTTQGVGILLKKDFSSLRDLLIRRSR